MLLLLVIYRTADISGFNEKINCIMDVIKRENKSCYMMGDYTINIMNYETHSLTGEFVDVMSSIAFMPLITRPTRVTATSATLIDNIFTNNLKNFRDYFQDILATDISDHYPVFYINRVNKLSEVEMFVENRIYNDKNKQAFFSVLQNIDWSELYNSSETQSSFDLLHNQLLALHNKHFPKVSKKNKI